jgi:hypothetical protein
MTEFEEQLRREMSGALAQVHVVPPAPQRVMARSERRRGRRRISLLLGATALLGILGGGVAVAGRPADVASRAAEFFQDSSDASTAKTGGVPVPADHVLAGSTATPQGRTVNLWVTDPAAATPVPDDRCYLVQLVAGGHQVSGVGGCGGLGDTGPILERYLDAVVGRAAQAQKAAASVTVSSQGTTATVRVVNGVFLVPFDVAGTTPRSFSLEFFDGTGRRIGPRGQVDA